MDFTNLDLIKFGLAFIVILMVGILVFLNHISETRKENIKLKKELELKNDLLKDSIIRENQLREFLDGYTLIKESDGDVL